MPRHTHFLTTQAASLMLLFVLGTYCSRVNGTDEGAPVKFKESNQDDVHGKGADGDHDHDHDHDHDNKTGNSIFGDMSDTGVWLAGMGGLVLFIIVVCLLVCALGGSMNSGPDYWYSSNRAPWPRDQCVPQTPAPPSQYVYQRNIYPGWGTPPNQSYSSASGY